MPRSVKISAKIRLVPSADLRVFTTAYPSPANGKSGYAPTFVKQYSANSDFSILRPFFSEVYRFSIRLHPDFSTLFVCAQPRKTSRPASAKTVDPMRKILPKSPVYTRFCARSAFDSAHTTERIFYNRTSDCTACSLRKFYQTSVAISPPTNMLLDRSPSQLRVLSGSRVACADRRIAHYRNFLHYNRHPRRLSVRARKYFSAVSAACTPHIAIAFAGARHA